MERSRGNYQKKKEVQRLVDAQIGIEEPPVSWVDVVTTKRAELMESRYWDAAQATFCQQ